MKVLFLILLGLFFANPIVAQTDIKLEIGAKLARKYISPESQEANAVVERERINVNDFRPFIRKTIDNVDYTIAFNEKTRKIEYIYTSDKDFSTGNGLRVGTGFSAKANQLTGCPGWHIYADETPDGWLPIVMSVKAEPSGLRGKDSLRKKITAGETTQVEIIGFFKNKGGC